MCPRPGGIKQFFIFPSFSLKLDLTIACRTAYQIDLSATRFPHPGTLPVRDLSIQDLECLEIFDFFNYPRLPPAISSFPACIGSHPMSMISVASDYP